MGKKEKSPKPEGGLMKKLIVLSLVLLVTFVFFTGCRKKVEEVPPLSLIHI